MHKTNKVARNLFNRNHMKIARLVAAKMGKGKDSGDGSGFRAKSKFSV